MAIVYPNQNDGLDDFIIGDVTLQIPPESIATYRVDNNNELSALRAKFPMFTKTGQSLLNAVVTWKSVLLYNPDGSPDYTQWEDLRRIVTIFKAAPFVQIQNSHLNSITQLGDKKMVFGLEQLNISTTPDAVDTLQVTLKMNFFNYFPYSSNFAYLNINGKGVNSDDDNTIFSDYLDEWMSTNLDQQNEMVNTANWVSNNSAETTLTYRNYQAFSNFQDPKDPNKAVLFKSYPGRDKGFDWNFDYATNKTSFYWYQSDLTFSSENYSNQTVITGVSVNMSNNFAQIPLASYQLPTYQHIGPGTTRINISFQSNDIDGDDLGQIQNALNVLNNQYFTLKPMWKSSNSLHKMQAIFIQNQLLNMLGIGSVIPSSFNTTTDADGLSVSAQLVLSQYENVFETLEPFRIKDPTEAHLSALQNISSPENLKQFNATQQQAIAPLAVFWQKSAAGDVPYLCSQLGVAPANPKQQMAFTNALGQLPKQPFSMAGADTSVFKQIADLQWPDFGQPVGQVVPGLANRAKTGSFYYTDLIIMTGWYQKYGPGSGLSLGDFLLPISNSNSYFAAAQVPFNANDWINKLTTYGNSSNPTLQSAVYQALFPLLYSGSQQFSNAVEQVANTPAYAAAIAAAQNLQANGPGSDLTNQSHVAYYDMGLRTLSYGSFDYTPSFYLADDSVANLQKVQANVISTLAESNSAQQNAFNLQVNNHQYTFTDKHLQLGSDLTGNNCADLFTRMNVDIQNPAHAFPTYKLFLMEDKAGLLTYAFDSFYSYSAVQDIEVIKYQDKPDTALIRISNIGGLLSHMLYDNSVDGHREWSKNTAAQGSVNIVSATDSADAEGPVADPIGAVVKDQSSYMNGVYFENGNGATPASLKYYPLQTGSKIQVRMGYSNNPDKLDPVFSGVVTQIDEESEMLTITAQSFMLELMDCPEDFIPTDHWNLLSPITTGATLISQSVTELISGNLGTAVSTFFSGAFNPHIKAPAFGQAILGDDGTAMGVMSVMMKSPAAKHFGRWQINSPEGYDQFLRGFSWTQNPPNGGLVNTALNTLNSLYDRSAENILTTSRFNSSGNLTHISDGAKRDWDFENKGNGPSEYHISGDKPFSPWNIMKDISRRFPENILTVKNFGFPWNCDATLVFANPYDFYRARAATVTELGGSLANDSTDRALFKQWWNSAGGRDLFITFGRLLLEINLTYTDGILAGLNPPIADFMNTPLIGSTKPSEQSIIEANYSYEGFTKYLTQWSGILQDASSTLDVALDAVINVLDFAQHNSASGRLEAAKKALRQLNDSSQHFIQKARSGTLTVESSDMVQPVIKFHYINQDNIIHNGIRLNGKVYNSVRIGEEAICANESIPVQHRRVLDVNDLIVSPDNLKGESNKEIRNAYAQSFLTEELGKMYQGELLIRGNSKIEPFDIVLLHDPITGMKGPIRVKKVIHSFDQQAGFITIITPECLILTNELSTASFLGVLDYSISAALVNKGLLNSYANFLDNHPKTTGTAALAAGGLLAASPTLVAGAEVAVTLIGSTLLLPVAAVAFVLLATYGLNTVVNAARTLIPVVPMPLSKYGIIWAAGLEGYSVLNFTELFADRYDNFLAAEFYPLVESWRTLSGTISTSISSIAPLSKSTSVASVKPTSKKLGQIPAETLAALEKYSQIYNFPLNLAKGVAWIESRGRQIDPRTGEVIKNPVSSAKGVMQLTNATAQELGVNALLLESNVEGGIKYLSRFYKRFNGDVTLTLAAYYSGLGAVLKHGVNQAAAQYAANIQYAIS